MELNGVPWTLIRGKALSGFHLSVDHDEKADSSDSSEDDNKKDLRWLETYALAGARSLITK